MDVTGDHQVEAVVPCSLCPETFGSAVDVQHHFLMTHSNGESIKVKLESKDHQQEAAINGDVSFTGRPTNVQAVDVGEICYQCCTQSMSNWSRMYQY